MKLTIDCGFHGGNILVDRVEEAAAALAIRNDSNGPWSQWFYFSVRGGAGRSLALEITNAGQSTYPDGWIGYCACVSEDGETWNRADTQYANGTLKIRYRPASDEFWVAYFPPYDDRRHAALMSRATSAGATADILGHSVDGRAIERLKVGNGARQVWLLGRQHSGETMASWWMEGAMDRLLNQSDPVGRQLLAEATIHCVPLINVDGAARGNLRGNAVGVSINRQWQAPDPALAPEVRAVLAAMDLCGVDFSLDVHGDETLPHVFVDGADADPLATATQIAGVGVFKASLLGANPAFQTAVGYPVTYGGDEAPGMCTRAVARRFGAVAVTLEMPFKDSLEAPDRACGWSREASRRLGFDSLEAVLRTLEEI